MNKSVGISISALFVLIGASATLAARPPGLDGNVTVVNDEAHAVPVAVQGDIPVTVQGDVPVNVQGVVPVTVQGDVTTTQRVPIAASGTWPGAGLTIPSMILHDIIFYVEEDNDNPNCRFFMGFVLDQFTSRTFQRTTLAENESAQFHYEAGIDTSNLRLGTSGGFCDINWVAMGFAVE